MSRLLFAVFSVHFALFAAARNTSAFAPDDRWTLTASGPTGLAGDPITLTWSVVPDGTQLIGEGSSDLIDFLETHIDDPVNDIEWFDIFNDAFNRWSELGGLTYLYEPFDDGATQGSSSSGSRGELGVRGDVRIGGSFIDGPSSTLAFNYLPDNGDMVLDTGDEAYFSNPASNYLRLRNTIMHEAGHGFGLNHIESSTSNFLLEPFITTVFDGPQFDDIRGLQWFYGDALEKTNGGQGNDTYFNATNLGTLAAGSSISRGTDAADTIVDASDTDFLSIDRNTDIDFFSVTVLEPLLLDVVLTPMGPTYDQAVQGSGQSSIDTSAISDLALDFYASDGTTLLASANFTGAGFAETIADFSLTTAGEYFIRVTGDDEIIQFYQLDVAAGNPVIYLAADYNEDGSVNMSDFGSWQTSFGLNAGGDTDSDGDTDGLDFLIWQQQFESETGPLASLAAVPEPATLLLALLSGLAASLRRRSK